MSLTTKPSSTNIAYVDDSYHAYANEMANSHMEHLTRLKTNKPGSALRKTTIICTIGPSCNSREKIREMIMCGMNIARVNFSHGTPEQHRETIRLIKEVRNELPDYEVAIALDTKGPEIRTGPIKGGGTIKLKEKEMYVVMMDPKGVKECYDNTIYVDYPPIYDELEAGQTIFIDDGVLSLVVIHKSPTGLNCLCLTGGTLASKKGVNLPSVRVHLPILSEQDKKDIQLGIEEEVDMIFASYIRNRAEVHEIRKALSNSTEDILVIAKIENQDSINNIDEIIDSADGVLVARGPLGVETASAKVAVVQKATVKPLQWIVAKCNRACKPVIIATQMLESMTINPRATRAECGDVANAVLDGADCVMLSAETAHGAHPIRAVQTMHRICVEAEDAYYQTSLMQDLRGYKNLNNLESIAIAATTAVITMHCSAIILVTTSGRSAQVCAQCRPPVPILALCASERIARQMHLYRGTLPVHYPGHPGNSVEDVEETTKIGIEIARKRGFVHSGDPVVILTGWPNEKLAVHSMMQIVYAD